jgi:hypothetical protein
MFVELSIFKYRPSSVGAECFCRSYGANISWGRIGVYKHFASNEAKNGSESYDFTNISPLARLQTDHPYSTNISILTRLV